jgi:glucose/arabinose dehydrogenase
MNKYYHSIRLVIVIIFIHASTIINHINAQPPILSFNSVLSSGLSSPVDFVNAMDGSNRIFIVEKGGIIKVFTSSFSPLGTFLTIIGIPTGNEEGLLSMAFDPDYENINPAIGGFFYIYFTNSDGDLEVDRYHVSSNPNIADPNSRVIVMIISHPVNSNHNGAKLLFGSDGYLYFGTGDGGGGGDQLNNAQNGNILLGKMLRINVTNSSSPPYYTIPSDNPYAGAGAPLDEIWAMGLRNPFRWSFDRQTQAMWIGDVGQGQKEEINYRPNGSTGGINYGWRCYEGNTPHNTTGCSPISNYVFPVYDYAHTSGPASVTGGVVYRGSLFPTLQGYYLAADVYSGNAYLINTTNFNTTVQMGLPNFIVCFGETENAEIYAVSLSGTVYHVEIPVTIPLPVVLIKFTAYFQAETIRLNWETATEENLKQFEVEYSTDGINFNTAGTVIAKNIFTGTTYNFNHKTVGDRLFYRLRIVDFDGSYTYSPIIKVSQDFDKYNFITPSLITTGMINMYLYDHHWQTVEIVNSSGNVVFRRNITGQTGKIDINVSSRMMHGVYVAILKNGESKISQKIIIQ